MVQFVLSMTLFALCVCLSSQCDYLYTAASQKELPDAVKQGHFAAVYRFKKGRVRMKNCVKILREIVTKGMHCTSDTDFGFPLPSNKLDVAK